MCRRYHVNQNVSSPAFVQLLAKVSCFVLATIPITILISSTCGRLHHCSCLAFPAHAAMVRASSSATRVGENLSSPIILLTSRQNDWPNFQRSPPPRFWSSSSSTSKQLSLKAAATGKPWRMNRVISTIRQSLFKQRAKLKWDEETHKSKAITVSKRKQQPQQQNHHPKRTKATSTTTTTTTTTSTTTSTTTTCSPSKVTSRINRSFSKYRIPNKISQRNIATIARVPISKMKSSTALQMVLSTPDTIIEQVSTQKLLDSLIDESVRTSSREPVMLQFNPKRGWIWRQWRGTVFSETWKTGLLNMVLATAVVLLYRIYPNLKDTSLQGFSILWGQLLSVTTFTLTFFLNQSYGLWRKCYDYSRRLQGRLNDLGLTLAAHATRVIPSSPEVPSTYTPQSRQALELVSRYVRVFNLLTYASFTRSHRPILTPRGMRRLVERGILTPKEREILIDAEIPATQRHNAVLVWLIRVFLEGRQTGVFQGGTGMEQQFLEKCHVIRAQYGAIGDELQGRMPLAYAHIVQVLLDVVLWMYPFMALSSGMAWHISILGTGLLTMFYQGLFDLAKQFLDPYDNENYGKGDDPLVIDTLIAETNAGSVRWMNSFQQQPWSAQLLKDAELYDAILPLRGYSVEELKEKEAKEEAERKERERVIAERKRKEEEKGRDRARELLMMNYANVQNHTYWMCYHKVNGTAVLSPEAEAVLMAHVKDYNFRNLTLMEISDGQVIATLSLLPSTLIKHEGYTTSIDDADTNSHKVSTLTGSSLVTHDNSPLIDNVETKTFLHYDTSEKESVINSSEICNDNSLLFDGRKEATREVIGIKGQNLRENIEARESDNVSIPTNLEIMESTLKDNNLNSDNDGNDTFQLAWFDEMGPDGNEYRLSQMLADENWNDQVEDYDAEIVAPDTAMTYDVFTRKATKIIEEVENELLETAEIMDSSPGSQADYDARKRESRGNSLSELKRVSPKKITNLMYDQTRLDPISQLWGVPIDVLPRKHMEGDEQLQQQRAINEDYDFERLYSLWGMAVPSKATTANEDVILPTDTKVWRDTALSNYEDESENNNLASTATGFLGTGVEWWDKVSNDGKESRLSMMLADEQYEEDSQEEEGQTTMTLEQFAMETENMIQQLEEERKETEAILNAPPNANSLENDKYDERTSTILEDTISAVAVSDKFEEMVMALSQEESVKNIENPAQVDNDGSALHSNLILEENVATEYTSITDSGESIDDSNDFSKKEVFDSDSQQFEFLS